MLTSYCYDGINWRNDSCLFCWKAVTIVAGCRMFSKLLNTKCLHCVCLRRRIGVSHPNLFSFLKQLQNVTTDNMANLAWIRNGMGIRRPKKKRNMQNDVRIKASIDRLDSGAYTRLQFLHAICHSLGAHTDAFQFASNASDDDDTANADDAVAQPIDAAPPTASAAAVGADDPQMCVVCLIAQRSDVALVPRGHARFCGNCRVYGQRLPDMPQSYQDGAAPVQLNF